MKQKYLNMTRELGPHYKLNFLISKGRQAARNHQLQILIGGLTLAALAGLGALIADASFTVLAANTVPGLYELSFDTTGPIPLTADNRLPVGQELILKAHVEDTSGVPAQRGEVIFQDCELKGTPAPSPACNSGSGVWPHVFQMSVMHPEMLPWITDSSLIPEPLASVFGISDREAVSPMA